MIPRIPIDPKAWQEGFDAGMAGVWPCPYPLGTQAGFSWSSGWIEGGAERARPRHYILNADHKPVVCSSMQWAEWFETSPDRLVARTHIDEHCLVSTVFLGLDHGWDGDLANLAPDGSLSPMRPVLFETAIFIDNDNPYMRRSSTWDEAQAEHSLAVSHMKGLRGWFRRALWRWAALCEEIDNYRSADYRTESKPDPWRPDFSKIYNDANFRIGTDSDPI